MLVLHLPFYFEKKGKSTNASIEILLANHQPGLERRKIILEQHPVVQSAMSFLISSQYEISIDKTPLQTEIDSDFQVAKTVTFAAVSGSDKLMNKIQREDRYQFKFGSSLVHTTTAFLKKEMLPVNPLTVYVLAELAPNQEVFILAKRGALQEEIALEFPRITRFIMENHFRWSLLESWILLLISKNVLNESEARLVDGPLFIKIGHDLLLPALSHRKVELVFKKPRAVFPLQIAPPASLWNEHPLKTHQEEQIEGLREEMRRMEPSEYLEGNKDSPISYVHFDPYPEEPIFFHNGDFDSHVVILGVNFHSKWPALAMTKENLHFPQRTSTKYLEQPLSSMAHQFLGYWKVLGCEYKVFAVHPLNNQETLRIFVDELKGSLMLMQQQNSGQNPLTGPWTKEVWGMFPQKNCLMFSREVVQAALESMVPRWEKAGVVISGIAIDMKKSDQCKAANSLDVYSITDEIWRTFGIPIVSEEDWALRTAAVSQNADPLSFHFSPFLLQKWGKEFKIYPKFGTGEFAGSSAKSTDPGAVRAKLYSEPLEFIFNHCTGNAFIQDLTLLSILNWNPLSLQLLQRKKEISKEDFLHKWLPVLQGLAKVSHASRLEITTKAYQGMGFLDLAFSFLDHRRSWKVMSSKEATRWFVGVTSFLVDGIPMPENTREGWQRARLYREVVQLCLTGEGKYSLLSSVGGSKLETDIKRFLLQHNHPPLLPNLDLAFLLRDDELDVRKMAFNLGKGSSKHLEFLEAIHRAKSAQQIAEEIAKKLIHSLKQATGLRLEKMELKELDKAPKADIALNDWFRSFPPPFFRPEWEAICQVKKIKSDRLASKQILAFDTWEILPKWGIDRVIDQRNQSHGWWKKKVIEHDNYLFIYIYIKIIYG